MILIMVESTFSSSFQVYDLLITKIMRKDYTVIPEVNGYAVTVDVRAVESPLQHISIANKLKLVLLCRRCKVNRFN